MCAWCLNVPKTHTWRPPRPYIPSKKHSNRRQPQRLRGEPFPFGSRKRDHRPSRVVLRRKKRVGGIASQLTTQTSWSHGRRFSSTNGFQGPWDRLPRCKVLCMRHMVLGLRAKNTICLGRRPKTSLGDHGTPIPSTSFPSPTKGV